MSKMNKHTPGPWKYIDGGVIVGGPSRMLAKGPVIPQVAFVNLPPCDEESDPLSVRDANGYLSAAAPEMLEVVEALVYWRERDHIDDSWWDYAREVIAKARGLNEEDERSEGCSVNE